MSRTATRHLWTGPREDPARYRVDLDDDGLLEVGGGGEGLVYRASRPGDPDLAVALKLFTNLGIGEFHRVERSAHLVAGVEHAGLMRQVETFRGRALGPREPAVDEDYSVIYSVAEWIDGVPLDTAIDAHGAAAGLHRVAEVARAVAALHEGSSDEAPDGVVHGDVKPSNVRVDGTGHAVLIDFGVTRAHDPGDLTPASGTYGWRAPEVVAGAPLGPAGDTWGIGALAFWVLAGEPPPADATAALPERLATLAGEKGFVNGAELADHVAALLVPDPATRPGDLRAWADRLDRLVDRRAAVPWRRRPAVVGILAVLLGLVAGVVLTLGVQDLGSDSEDRPRPGTPGSALLLARPFAVPDSRPGETVLRRDRVVDYREGTVRIGGDRDGTRPLLANDEIEVQVTHPDGAIATYVHNFGAASGCDHDDVLPATDVTHLFVPGRNTVRVVIRGGCDGADVGLGGFAGAGTPIWLSFAGS